MTEYGPQVPVSRFCESLKAWAAAVAETERGQAVAANAGHLVAFGPERDQRLARVPELVAELQLPMMKSNLLYRLIYLGEPLRTTRCPTHQGRWSGCSWGERPCDCQKVRLPDGRVVYDMNVTGWLLEGNPPVREEGP